MDLPPRGCLMACNTYWSVSEMLYHNLYPNIFTLHAAFDQRWPSFRFPGSWLTNPLQRLSPGNLAPRRFLVASTFPLSLFLHTRGCHPSLWWSVSFSLYYSFDVACSLTSVQHTEGYKTPCVFVIVNHNGAEMWTTSISVSMSMSFIPVNGSMSTWLTEVIHHTRVRTYSFF